MTYENFKESLEKEVRNLLGADLLMPKYTVTPKRAVKENGLVLDGLCISEAGSSLGKVIYINHFYKANIEKCAIDSFIKKAAKDIVKLYQESDSPFSPTLSDTVLSDFEYVKPRIMFQLINTAANTELLSSMPHIPYLNLSVIFYIDCGHYGDNSLAIKIKNDAAKSWGVDAQDLWEIAKANAAEKNDLVILPMTDIINNMGHSSLDTDIYEPPFTFYMITNKACINGASCILYPNALQTFADKIEDDIIILPSSIHECLLLAKKDVDNVEGLSQMVTSINAETVSLKDRLSNQVYLFRRSTGKLEIVSNAPEKI